MKRNILLVDTNFSSAPVYNHLHDSGNNVYVVGGNPDDFLAKSVPNYIELDYKNIDALREKIKYLSINHIIPGCNDVSYEVCSELNKEDRYPGIDCIEVTKVLNNKKNFRHFAKKNGFSVPELIPTEQGYFQKDPLIIKPVDAFSGKGISVLKTPEPSLYDKAIKLAKCESRSGACLVEKFVKGNLYSHSAFIVKNRINSDFFVSEYCSVNPFVVDTSHIDDELPEKTKLDIRLDMENMANILGLKDGLLHTQFIYDGKDYFLIEVTRRSPGDLYSRLIELSSGYGYSENYSRIFLGKKLHKKEKYKKSNYIIRHTITQRRIHLFSSLVFKKSKFLEQYVPLATTGDILQPSPGGRVGILFSRATSGKGMKKMVLQYINKTCYEIK